MFHDYDWGWMPGLQIDLMVMAEERAKEAKQRAEQEKAKLKAEAEKAEKAEKNREDEKKAEEEDKAKKEEASNQNKNALDVLVDFMKNDFLEDKPATASSIPIHEFAKSKNVPVEHIVVRPPPTRHPEWPYFPEFANNYLQKPTRTRSPYVDFSDVPSDNFRTRNSDNFGTRNFLPPLMAGVAFLSLGMILFALCRCELYRSSRRKRTKCSIPTAKLSSPEDGYELEESSKLNTFEPSAPTEIDLYPQLDEDPTKITFVRKENNRAEENARAITDFRLRNQMATNARKSSNSLALVPLLEHVFGRTNECENCRHPFASQRCQLGEDHRIF